MQPMPQRERYKPYMRLLVMTVLSFASMYILMYAMVDRLQNVHPSLNQLYMAALMTAPMVALEMLLMRSMYPDQKINIGISLLSAVVLVTAFVSILEQVGISDREFLRSMIPHHSGAILMCREADLSDSELKKLCQTIITGQQAEIEQMTTILRRDP